MRKGICVKQRDIADCGAACLASVASYHKLHLPVARIRQLAHTDRHGTNVLGLIEAAEQLGFVAKGVRGTYDALLKIPKPAIVHLKLPNGLLHYVVLYDANQHEVRVMDPGTGEIQLRKRAEFEAEWTGILVLLVPSEGFEVGNERVSNPARLMQLLRPHRGVMAQALVGAIFFSIIGLSTSVYIQKITDFVLVNGNVNLLNVMSVAMLVLLVLQVLLGVFQTVFTLKTGQLIDSRLILGYYKHLLQLPQRFFDTMQTGEIVSRVNDAVKIRSFINNTLIGLIVNVLIVLFSFGLMFVYSWQLALLVLAVVPVYVGLYIITNRLNRRTERRIMEQAAALESQLVESINTVGTIKRFGIEGYANERTEHHFFRLLGSGYTSGLNATFTNYSTMLASRAFTVAVLWVGSYFVLRSQLTMGELLSFYAILGYFSGPLNSIIGVNMAIQHAYIASDRLFEIMDLQHEQPAGQGIALTDDSLGDITFSHVKFRYGSRAEVFTDLNLTIRRGSVTAIIGESGSGKSTLIHLLQNIYPIAGGKIRIGDTDIAQIDNRSLRQQVGVIPQRIDLFKGSIAENIAIGDLTPDLQRIAHICQRVGLMPLIEELPEGLSTDIGENGVALSGGQRQKVAFARVLYRNPSIVIMDEATSALDSEAEQQLMGIIGQLKAEGRTVIMIAHRLSTVVRADEIVLMERGQIVEQGSHPDLYRPGTRYHTMWQRQLPQVG